MCSCGYALTKILIIEIFVRCGHIQGAIAMSMCEIGTLYRTEGITVGSNTLSALVAIEILVAIFWLESRLSVSCSIRCPTMHSTPMRRLVAHIVPLVKATDVPLFLLSGRPFVVLPSLCQSLLVDLSIARNFSFPPCIFSISQPRYRCQLFPYDMSDTQPVLYCHWGAVVAPEQLQSPSILPKSSNLHKIFFCLYLNNHDSNRPL